MIPMILELRGEVVNDVVAVEAAKVWSSTGEAIAEVAECESIRTKIHTANVGVAYSVSVMLKANAPSNSVACDLAKEWKALAHIDVEVSVYTGGD